MIEIRINKIRILIFFNKKDIDPEILDDNKQQC